MRLDVRVRTSSATTVQASLADNIQLDADLRLRGTAATPSMLGRILITEGDLNFFGSQYHVTSGTINFYNPTRIEPVLNLTLGTTAKGVKVTLNVTGPIDNMKLNYSSDPPLQFQEIVRCSRPVRPLRLTRRSSRISLRNHSRASRRWVRLHW